MTTDFKWNQKGLKLSNTAVLDISEAFKHLQFLLLYT
jgi:hypothetical protein